MPSSVKLPRGTAGHAQERLAGRPRLGRLREPCKQRRLQWLDGRLAVLAQAFNGAGDTGTPTLNNLLCFWIVELAVGWTLSHKIGLGPSGAFWSIVVSYTLPSVTSALIFRQGRWMRQKV